MVWMGDGLFGFGFLAFGDYVPDQVVEVGKVVLVVRTFDGFFFRRAVRVGESVIEHAFRWDVVLEVGLFRFGIRYEFKFVIHVIPKNGIELGDVESNVVQGLQRCEYRLAGMEDYLFGFLAFNCLRESFARFPNDESVHSRHSCAFFESYGFLVVLYQLHGVFEMVAHRLFIKDMVLVFVSVAFQVRLVCFAVYPTDV